MNERLFLTTLLNSLNFTYVLGGTTELHLVRNHIQFKSWLSNPFTLISQVSNGGLFIDIDGGSFEVSSGQAMIIPAHVRHKITVLHDGTISKWLNIHYTLFEHFQLFDFIETPYVTSEEIGNKVGELQPQIIQCMNIDRIDPGHSLSHVVKAKSLVFELLEWMLSISDYNVSGYEDIRKYERFHPIFKYIENHLDQKIKISQLAEILLLSRSHFYKEFKESFHMSPLQYIQVQRLKRAQYLLATTHDTMDEIAGQIGYRDAYQFARFFKSMHGSSPGQYRKTITGSFQSTSN